MKITAYKCPNCGSGLSLDPKYNYGSCKYCGSKIIISESTKNAQSDNVNAVGKLIKMADFEKSVGNNEEAYKYYLKSLEIDPKNYMAMYEKSLIVGKQSKFDNDKFSEFIKGIEFAMLNVPNHKKAGFKEKAGAGISEVVEYLFKILELRTSDNMFSIIVTESSFEDHRNYYKATRSEIKSIRNDFHKKIVDALDMASNYNPNTRLNNLRMIVNISPYDELAELIDKYEVELKRLDSNYISKKEAKEASKPKQLPLQIQLIVIFCMVLIFILMAWSGSI